MFKRKFYIRTVNYVKKKKNKTKNDNRVEKQWRKAELFYSTETLIQTHIQQIFTLSCLDINKRNDKMYERFPNNKNSILSSILVN